MEIVAAARRIDGAGDLSHVEAFVADAERAGLRVATFEIAGAEIPWRDELPEHTLRGAFAPLEIMRRAQHMFADGVADLVVVRGNDPIRSKFRNDRAALQHALRAYEGQTFLDGYELLTRAFVEREGIAVEAFRALAAELFENYLRTWTRRHPGAPPPDARWFTLVNELFRGVDCANPYIDFEGCLVLGGDRAGELAARPSGPRIVVSGLALEQACPDDIGQIAAIAPYEHLRRAFVNACGQARVDFAARFLRGEAMLEVYTCYPVVPLAFLLRTGLAASCADVPPLLREHEITLSGGLNLGRAPGNNTTLSALIDVAGALRDESRPSCAGVHSVGALGYVQAFCILERRPR